MTRLISPVLLALALLVSGRCPAADSWDGMMEQLRASAQPAEVVQIEAAFKASPKLELRLRDLVDGGRLTTIRVLPEAVVNPEPKPGILLAYPRGAAAIGTELLLSRALLAELRALQATTPDKPLIVPNSTVYTLSHLAYHMAHQYELDDADRAFFQDAQAAEQAKDGERRLQDSKALWIMRTMQHDASAWLQGWNDAFNAGKAAYRDMPEDTLIPQLLGGMDHYLIDGAVLGASLEVEGMPPPRVTSNGIQDDGPNRNAIGLALLKVKPGPIE